MIILFKGWVIIIIGEFETYMESVSDLLAEDDDEPIEACEEEENDDKSVGHDLVTGLDSSVMVLQFLGSHVDVVFTTAVRQP